MRTTILLLFLGVWAQAQVDYGCNGERYLGELFETVSKTTVEYGSNVDVFGDSIDLFMDIYEPQDEDFITRPVIIFAHGGSFISGTRQDMANTCESFAKKGYVAATIDYRLLSIFQGIPDSISALDITVKASHDMRAAIRWFKHSAIDGGNPYKIDPDQMFIGGYSAGAITAIIAGTFDEGDSDLPFIQQLLDQNGGFQGSTGNPDFHIYGEEVKGIVNYSGAIYDTSWIDETDPFIVSYHGTADETVPFGYDDVVVLGNPIVPLHGSGSIHEHLDKLGVDNKLYTVEGGGHTDIYFLSQFEEDRVAATMSADSSLTLIICGSLVSVHNPELKELSIYPNPVNDRLFIDGIDAKAHVILYDISGQVIQSTLYGHGVFVDDLKQGMYVVHIEDGALGYVGRFIKQ